MENEGRDVVIRSYRIGSDVVGDFKLTLETTRVCVSDPFIAVSVEVFSEGFSGRADMKVAVKNFGQFAVDLKNLYDALKGSARFEDAYDARNFVEFTVKKTGRVVVTGSIYECYPWSHRLTFENEIDQTYLQTFAKELFDDFSRTNCELRNIWNFWRRRFDGL